MPTQKSPTNPSPKGISVTSAEALTRDILALLIKRDMTLKEIAASTKLPESFLSIWFDNIDRKALKVKMKAGKFTCGLRPECLPQASSDAPSGRAKPSQNHKIGHYILSRAAEGQRHFRVQELAKKLGKTDSNIYIWRSNIGEEMGFTIADCIITAPEKTEPSGPLGNQILAAFEGYPAPMPIGELATKTKQTINQIYVWIIKQGRAFGVTTKAGTVSYTGRATPLPLAAESTPNRVPAQTPEKGVEERIGVEWGDRPNKQVCRALMILDNRARSEIKPLRLIGLPGEGCTFERFCVASGLKLKHVVGLEKDTDTHGIIEQEIRTLPPELRKNFQLIKGTDKQLFVLDEDSLRDKIHLSPGADIFNLDYWCAYDTGVRQSISLLAENPILFQAPFENFGEAYVYITVRTRGTQERSAILNELRNRASIPIRAAQNPEIPAEGLSSEDAAMLDTDYNRAFGISYDVESRFAVGGKRSENIRTVYYRDGKTVMLFMGFRIIPMLSEDCDNHNPPQEPVFLGIERFANLPHTVEWTRKMMKLGVIPQKLEGREKAFLYAVQLFAESGLPKEEIIARLDDYLPKEKTLAALGKPDITHTPMKPVTNERAILIHKILAILRDEPDHWLSQKALEAKIIKIVPFAAGLAKKMHKFNQSHLCNSLAFAKALLTQGGYATSDGTEWGLTEKGKRLAKRDLPLTHTYTTSIRNGAF